ncbi:MAG TPA: bacillithiol system redox-active protein YtxJ [Cytophagaceae bacterium]|jgi:bacillithiol system protein YtxJ
MDWLTLDSEEQLNQIKANSSKPSVIFKHSTRCSISATALSRLERSWNKQEVEGIDFYFLDLLNHRPVSSKIEELFGVTHQSPQVLIIQDGTCTYNASHLGISYNEIKNQALKKAGA